MNNTHELLLKIQKDIDEEDQRLLQSANVQTVIPLNINNLFGIDRHRVLEYINPSYTFRHITIGFDSRFATNRSEYSISWTISNYVADQRANVISLIKPLTNIIGMKCNPCIFPTGMYLMSPFNGEMFMFINELSAQSFQTPDKKYHFYFTMDPNNKAGNETLETFNHEIIPANNGYFWFNKPITSLDTITMQFLSTSQPINIEYTGLYSFWLFTGFQTGLDTTIIFRDNPRALKAGQRVWINNIVTSPSNSALVEELQRPEGHILIEVVYDLITELAIQVDTRTWVGAAPDICLFVKAEFIMQIEFICLPDIDYVQTANNQS